MSGATEKSLAILEYLVAYPDGASLVRIATELNQLRSGCHRTLHELIRYGYVRQLPLHEQPVRRAMRMETRRRNHRRAARIGQEQHDVRDVGPAVSDQVRRRRERA